MHSSLHEIISCSRNVRLSLDSLNPRHCDSQVVQPLIESRRTSYVAKNYVLVQVFHFDNPAAEKASVVGSDALTSHKVFNALVRHPLGEVKVVVGFGPNNQVSSSFRRIELSFRVPTFFNVALQHGLSSSRRVQTRQSLAHVFRKCCAKVGVVRKS